jgi:hypothetical protein
MPAWNDCQTHKIRSGLMGVVIAVGLLALAGISIAKPRSTAPRSPHRQRTVLLLGRRTVASVRDTDRAGRAKAFPFTAVASGVAKRVAVYVARGNRATVLRVGVYSNANHHPRKLLTSGSSRRLRPRAWVILSLKQARIARGRTYWIAVLGRGGAVAFRDQSSRGCHSQESRLRVNLSRLPARWHSGRSWSTCHLSAYVVGPGTPVRSTKPAKRRNPSQPVTGPAAGSASAPANTAAPVLSGQTVRGVTLTATTGSWTNSPTSVGFRWEDCDASGAGCVTIAGATSSSYPLATGDVNHTIRVVVTAANAAGSASATSAQTATVTAFSVNCTRTLSPASITSTGGTLESALQSASGGSTICLSSGTSGDFSVAGVRPASNVTVQPAPGATVSLGNITVGANTHNLTFTGLGINGVGIGSTGPNCCGNLSFTYDAFTTVSYVRDVVNSNILFAHDTFDNINACSSCYEGRIEVISSQVSQPDGVTIQNNLMSGGSSDGVQDAAIGTQILDNEFSNIIQSNCGAIHCDAIQTVGATGTVIAGNYFHNTTDCILMADGGANITIENNECGPMASDSSFWIEFGGISGLTFSHNTVTATDGGEFGNSNAGEQSSNVTFTNNVEYSSPSLTPGESVLGTTSESYNLVKSCGTLCGGTHDITGTPMLVGGSQPTTWSGFALKPGSLGVGTASDGLNRGISSFAVTPGP